MDEQGQEKVIIRKTKAGFASREQKTGFILLVTTGCLAFLLGVFYLVREVNRPFDINYSGPEYVTSDERQAQELEKQKVTDTDGDTLTDYDELYVYRTSPYLSDSDSDGYSDAQEIAADEDPNCPRGKDCFSIYETGSTTTNSLVNLLSNEEETAATNLTDLQTTIKSLSAAQIRQLLIESGASEAEINQLTDEQLTEVYQSVIKRLEESGQLEQLLNASTTNQ